MRNLFDRACCVCIGAMALGIVTLLVAAPARADDVVRDDLAPIFAEFNISGGFALSDPATGDTSIVNQDWSRLRVAPASTFKIINAMMALDTGAVKSTREVIPYGGGPTRVAAWAADMNLGEAVRVSNVPVFQEIARRIGLDAYRHRLSAIEYGNAEVGDDVTTFWLNGPLAISPVEQTRVLANLVQGQLGFTDRAQAFIRAALLVDEDKASGRRLYGKTGWNADAQPPTGWFVGWTDDGKGNVKTFALLGEIRDQAAADQRIPLARKLLQALGAL